MVTQAKGIVSVGEALRIHSGDAEVKLAARRCPYWRLNRFATQGREVVWHGRNQMDYGIELIKKLQNIKRSQNPLLG